MSGPRLPATVDLRPGMVPAGEVHRSLGISRAVAHLWRRRGMPASDRRGRIDTAALALWLGERGVVVTFV